MPLMHVRLLLTVQLRIHIHLMHFRLLVIAWLRTHIHYTLQRDTTLACCMAGRRSRHRRISSWDANLEGRKGVDPSLISPASSGDLTATRSKVFCALDVCKFVSAAIASVFAYVPALLTSPLVT